MLLSTIQQVGIDITYLLYMLYVKKHVIYNKIHQWKNKQGTNHSSTFFILCILIFSYFRTLSFCKFVYSLCTLLKNGYPFFKFTYVLHVFYFITLKYNSNTEFSSINITHFFFIKLQFLKLLVLLQPNKFYADTEGFFL